MKPSKKQKLIKNTGFQQLSLSALTRVIKEESDRLTTGGGITNGAEEILMKWIREKAKTGSLQDHTKKSAMSADTHFVAAILLGMFDNSESDGILTTEPEGLGIIVDWDDAQPKIEAKIKENKYLFMLAGATPEDFAKTDLGEAGNWVVPV